MWLKLEEQWKTFEVPFCAFMSEGWSGSVKGLDPSKLLAFHFKIGERQDAEFWLDDLAFYRDAPDSSARHCGLPCPLDAVPTSAIIDPSRSDATLTQNLSVHTFEQTTKSCGPITRRYLSYVPSRLPSRASAPVLFMLHGSGANAELTRSYLARNRFDALAERDGFIVVYANAAPGVHTSPDPRILNSGAWRQGYFDDGQVDDVDYLERVLTDLTVRGIIDGNNAMFLTGISNGGGMVLEGARRLANRVIGVAALMPYDGEHPKPVPDLTHTKLKRVLIAYTPNDPGLLPGYHETLAPLPAQWATALGLPAAVIASPQVTSLPDVIAEGADYQGKNAVALATRNSRVTQLDMVAPNGTRQVRVLILDHAGHLWPNPTPLAEDWVLNQWGFRNQDFDAADMVCDFLRIAKE
jgi:poly(3-hydroxybutyrate) depolymerase